MSKITELGSAQINGNDAITIVLSEPDDIPASVVVHWPLNSSVIGPDRFGDTAGAMVKLWSEAHIALAGIKAKRKL